MSSSPDQPAAKLDVRLFVECADDQEARVILAALGQALQSFSPRPDLVPSRYWKMPHLFEFSLDLGEASREAMERLLALAPQGWTHGGEYPDLWAVWNRPEGVPFLVPGAEWAEVRFNADEVGPAPDGSRPH